ncbi:ras-like protein family member 12 isoform X2 [Peromyscus californicus insignis]|uniref:ras-like protein family member 12 isoform X2 n=1 Tax=Peromyscus californicus insignis TaxID=564181 RepID=UPI0022A76021|nr:ras-like protein family member 12 isoform X2 [Peromyscus californicus insignis]
MSSVFGKPRAGSGPHSVPLEVNLAILGRRGAGKSALTVKFLTKRFISEYDPNLEDTYSSEETVDHQPVHLRVMDTADLDTPRNCERYLNWAHAFLVVYSVDSRQSFESSSSYLELLALHAKETQRGYPALLLGNKLDMAQYSFGNTSYHLSSAESVTGRSPRLRARPWQAGSGACFLRSLPAWTSSMCSMSSMRRCGRCAGSWRRAPRPGPSSSLRRKPCLTRPRSQPDMGWPAALSTLCPRSA